jgi:hypothetical protein
MEIVKFIKYHIRGIIILLKDITGIIIATVLLSVISLHLLVDMLIFIGIKSIHCI